MLCYIDKGYLPWWIFCYYKKFIYFKFISYKFGRHKIFRYIIWGIIMLKNKKIKITKKYGNEKDVNQFLKKMIGILIRNISKRNITT